LGALFDLAFLLQNLLSVLLPTVCARFFELMPFLKALPSASFMFEPLLCVSCPSTPDLPAMDPLLGA
jgi:hypothetical protein